jgi:GNAT superfamily N-acetyltransferase
VDGNVRSGLLSTQETHITIEPTRLDHPETEALIASLVDDLRDRYGDDDVLHDLGVVEFTGPAGGTFLLARIAGRPVGCGGLRRHDARAAELKRMYVVPDQRRSGVARMLLAALEAHAARLGYESIVLETGVRQPEAIALYETSGYRRISNFEPWVDEPLSVCFERRLGDA